MTQNCFVAAIHNLFQRLSFLKILEILCDDETKGLASYCKAETTFTFHFSILTLSSAFLSINNTEMKSESGFSLAMAIQPFCLILISR